MYVLNYSIMVEYNALRISAINRYTKYVKFHQTSERKVVS